MKRFFQFKGELERVFPSQRLWLEASTLSNRGEMRQHLPTDNELHPSTLAGSQYHNVL